MIALYCDYLTEAEGIDFLDLRTSLPCERDFWMRITIKLSAKTNPYVTRG